MPPEYLKIIASILAGVSVLCLTLAGRAWLQPDAPPGAARPERTPFRGGLILFVVSLGVLAALWLISVPLGWKLDRVLWVGLGSFLALMTVTRPWWFWENYRARWLRGTIGDEATAAIYLVIAGLMAWVGLFTDWRLGQQ